MGTSPLNTEPLLDVGGFLIAQLVISSAVNWSAWTAPSNASSTRAADNVARRLSCPIDAALQPMVGYGELALSRCCPSIHRTRKTVAIFGYQCDLREGDPPYRCVEFWPANPTNSVNMRTILKEPSVLPC